MLNNLRSTEKIGVEVWPNVSTTPDDLSLSLRLQQTATSRGLCICTCFQCLPAPDIQLATSKQALATHVEQAKQHYVHQNGKQSANTQQQISII